MDQIGGRAAYAQGKDTVSLISFHAQSPAPSLFSTRTLLRLAVLSAGILSAILISTAYSLTRGTGAPSLRSGWLESKQSPLHHVLLRDQTLTHTSKINEKATLEVKTLVIAETVVPYEKREMLSVYVRQQLEASDVMSSMQKAAVMTMVEMAPVEHSINREERGEGGSLRNSAVIALIKTYRNNIHFMLIGVRIEPKLGWRRISSKERNVWNDNLSKVMYNKIREQAKTFSAYGTPTQLLKVFNEGHDAFEL